MPNPWREHPRLRELFEAEHPDDLQVIVHAGGPAPGGKAAEVVWVRITGGTGDIFTGTVLDQPRELANVSKGNIIVFKVPASGDLPIMVTEKYLAERSEWMIHPCSRCGLTELFDAPSDLLRAIFPPQSRPVELQVFTCICAFCGGTQLVHRLEAGSVEPLEERKKPWWRFWR